MIVCPKCGAHHDSNVPCLDRTGELMRNAGIERKCSHVPDQELGETVETVKKSNRVVAVIFVILAGLLGVAIILSQLTSR